MIEAVFAPPHRTIIQTVEALGLTSGLKLCLDAADAASYTSGQSWLDRSGNGHDFFLGIDGSTTTTDPTFNGSPGGLSANEYFSFDGGDQFRYDSANEAWMNNLHKDGALFTLAGYFKPVATDGRGLLGTNGANPNNTGIAWIINPSSGNAQLTVGNGSGTFARSLLQNMGVTSGAWQFLAVSVDEPNNVGFHFRNGVAATTAAASYTTPSTGDATYTMEISGCGNSTVRLPDTSCAAVVLAWEGVALSSGQLAALFNATRRRYGI